MSEHQGGSAPILIVSGMHRSGTSYVASALKSAGLDLGQRLMAAATGNKRGHLENLDFVGLHEKILQFHGLSRYGWTLAPTIEVPPELRLEAERVVKENAGPGPWGWKDPRTTLFLQFWAELLPQAHFLLIYRAPWEVVDSLFRRGDDTFRHEPALAVRMWEHYNRLACQFCERYSDRCILADVDFVTRDPSLLIELIRKRFSVPLSVPDRSSFDESLFRKEPGTSHRPSLIEALFPEAYRLWLQLRSISDQNTVQDHLCYGKSDNWHDTLSNYVLNDWMELRTAQRELARSEATLYEVRSELYQAQSRIEYLERSRLWKIRNKLNDLRQILRK